MECLIMNGNPKPTPFDGYLEGVARELEEGGHEAVILTLREMKLRFCTGCWSCWWRTPGLCAIRDDMENVLPAMVKSDLVIWASPLILGAPSSLMKTVQDRFIPLVHPYIILHEGECHHRHRYERNADIGFICEPEPGDSPEDVDIAMEFYRRFALNTRTRLRLAATTKLSCKEAANAAIAG